MRKPMTILVLAVVVLAAMVSLGFRLAGALQQLDALAGGNARVAATSTPRASTPMKRTAVVAPATSPGVVTEQATTPFELPDQASVAYARFDTEAAVREAGERDANVAALLNDPDPAVGGAVRDFITQLDAPPGN